MASSGQLINTFIKCGHQIHLTTLFNDQSSIDQIHEQVRCLCGAHIPNSFCLMFYNGETKKLIKLNQNQLDDRCNPFRLDSSVDDQDVERMMNYVDLYVVDASEENDTQSGIPCNETSSISSDDIINEIESEQDVPINMMMHNVFTNHNEESLAAYPNENPSDSNFSSNDTGSTNINPDLADLVDAILIEKQPIQYLLVNSDSSEQIQTGVAMPPQNHSSTSIQFRTAIELNGTQNINSNRPYFSRDVKPEQKSIYMSDQFNQKKKEKTNGYVARIQGIKLRSQRTAPVWPKIRIPELFRNKHNVRLVVYVVSEQFQDGMRVWFKHRDKGFLPKGFTRDTLPINPIEFDVNETTLTLEGDLILDLQMTTLWNKLKELVHVYQLDEQSTIKLHSALHNPSSPRLFCILKDGCPSDVNRICLSDFIRAKSPVKRTATSITNIAQTNSVICKRARAK